MIHTLRTEGMSCSHCIRAVTQAVQALDPAAQVEVALDSGTLRVTTATLARDAVAAAVQAEGYRVRA